MASKTPNDDLQLEPQPRPKPQYKPLTDSQWEWLNTLQKFNPNEMAWDIFTSISDLKVYSTPWVLRTMVKKGVC